MTLWDNKPVFDRVIDLLGQRKKGYVKFNKARETIINLMRPDLGSDTEPDGDGSFFGEEIYDGVGSWAVGVMSKGFQGGLVSADTDWFEHNTPNQKMAQVDELSVWLQEIKDHHVNVYRASNFYRVLAPFTKDGVSIGSPVMFIEETDVVNGEITFLPQHFKTVFLFYDGNNNPNGVIIKDNRWTVKRICDKFAPTAAEQKEKLPMSIKKDIESGNYYKEHTVIRACFKGDNPLWDVDEFEKPPGEWVSAYYVEETEEENKNTPLLTEQYFSRPFVVWDYDKKPWESVSRTPAYEAVHDVHAQQDMTLDQTTNRKLKNNPPRAVLEDHRNIVDFNPEGITPVAAIDWDKLPKAIDVVGDIRLSREEMEFNAGKIKRWFHTDEFLKFTDMTRDLRQPPSATQIIKIAAELATQINPGITTYTSFLADVDARVMDIESRAGRGPFRPQRIAEISAIVQNIAVELGEKIDLSVVAVFTGPLARAQKVKQELDPILDGLGVAAGMIEQQPELVNAIKWHGTLERVFKATGFPMTEFVPKDEYDEIVAAIRAAAAQQQQQAFMLEAGKVAPGVMDAMKGSAA